jgi:hypothetical protein
MANWKTMTTAKSLPLHPKREREITEWAKRHGYDDEAIAATIEAHKNVMTYMNNTYVATVLKAEVWGEGWPEMAQLSIRRIDRKVIHDWRALQQIKSDIFGANAEGVELYPAADRVVDTANSYHIFVPLDPSIHFPFGWRTGLRADDAAQNERPGAGGEL